MAYSQVQNHGDVLTDSSFIPSFITSAPGKVIVYGEHAVVHGKAAIAAAIALRSYLYVTPHKGLSELVTLRFPDIGLEHSWTQSQLPWQTVLSSKQRKASLENETQDRVSSLDVDILAAVQPYVDAVSADMKQERRKVHHAAALSFLYLYMSLASLSWPSCTYTLRSTIPIGAGLGSSASISACIASALLLQKDAILWPHLDQTREEAEIQVERINQWAFVGEMCIHGNPSGVDNTVASKGKAVLFRRPHQGLAPDVQQLASFPELPLWLINTKVSRSTAVEVAKVSSLKQALPGVTNTILQAIDEITTAAHALIESKSQNSPHQIDSLATSTSGINFDSNRNVDFTSIAALGTLMNVSHGLLVSLGVSHPRLERIRELVDIAEVGYTKLTGAGGGGSAIVLLKPDLDVQKLKTLEQTLHDEGFECFETKLGGSGVAVLWPPVLANERIDSETFLAATNAQDIESLVGNAPDCLESKWKFWGPQP